MAENKHGGKRSGAGRKSRFNEPRVQLRIPVSCVPAVESLISKVVELKQYRRDELEILRPADELRSLARPLFASPVPAGFPSPADDYIEGQLDLNEHFIEKPSATFFVRVIGESMIGAGILPGDILVVDRSIEPRHGCVVVAVVNNELTVKRLYKKGTSIELRPENPAFPVIALKNDMELSVWGVVSGVTRKL